MARAQLAPEAGSEDPLHVKYRPTRLDDLWGQEELVRSLKQALEKPTRPHSYLLLGPSGCGKTTIARIIAKHMGVAPENILEADAASNTGIDAARSIADTLKYKGFGESSLKMVILDECHALSKAAWQSWLKVLEEPPAHVYFALCTTEPGKVPDTVQTRCASYTVRSLRKDDMFDFLEDVLKQEGKRNFPEDVIEQVVKIADGSPRKALVALAMVLDCEDAKEASIILAQPIETEEVIELCRALVSTQPPSWADVVRVLGPLKDEDPEGLRLVIVNYVQSVLLKANEKRAGYLLDVLAQFMRPINRSEKLAPLLLAFGNIVMPAGE